jgi:hypothetical protein
MVINIVIILALLVVAGTLVAGLVVMARGGDVAGKWSNRLMRYRVLAQAVAVVILLLALYIKTQG